MALSRRRLFVALALSAAAWSTSVVSAGAVMGPELPTVTVPPVVQRDVLVHGGTPAGVTAAIAAAEQGASVTLLAEGSTVGGAMSNGVSASDIGSSVAVQGLAATFFDRVRRYYRGSSDWRFEPRIAERIFRDMLADAGVDVRLGVRLGEVRLADRRVVCVTPVGADEICARNYVDASYTGDLIAAAGIPHRLGLADLRAYDEYMSAQRGWVEVLTVPSAKTAEARTAFERNPFVRTETALRPYDETARLGMPSLTYRLCVTRDEENRTPFRRGDRYDTWVPSFRLLVTGTGPGVQRRANGTLMSDLFHLAELPGGKYDLNAGRASITNVPAPADYFDSWSSRRRADRELRAYVEAFYHFVQHDPAVPAPVQKAFRSFGLCADEFVDNGNWPREPYVREGRRIKGRHTLTVHDIFTDRQKTDAIALGSYDVDTKLSQMVFADGTLYRDLGMHTTAPVYEIPYSAMVPAPGGITNLLAPVGLSSSPTSYGSLRMEPQYMALGQAAGVAAALATQSREPVATLPAKRVQRALYADGVSFRAADVCRDTPLSWRAAGGYTGDCRVLPVAPG